MPTTSTVTFNADAKVLFREEQVYFCDNCECDDPDGPDTPIDPDIHCIACKSVLNCGFCGVLCTPGYFKATFAGITYKTTCFDCTSNSVIVFSGQLNNYILEIDPLNPCRWVYTEDDPDDLVIRKYTSDDCTGDIELATKLTVSVERLETAFYVEASVAFEDGSTYLLFTATYPVATGCDHQFTVNGDTTFAHECDVRLGHSGTVVIELCPELPKTCVNTHEDTDCLLVTGLSFPTDCAFCDSESQDEWDGRLEKDSDTLWDSAGSLEISGCGNNQVKIEWLEEGDTFDVGCGYYLSVVNNGTDVVAVYYLDADNPMGTYNLVYEQCELTGFNDSVVVTECPPISCAEGAARTFPSAVPVRITDYTTPPGGVPGVFPNLTGIYTALWNEDTGQYEFNFLAYFDPAEWSGMIAGHFMFYLVCDPTGWVFEIQHGVAVTWSTYTYYGANFLRPNVGTYPNTGGSGSVWDGGGLSVEVLQ
jgi:hypothetical protein